MSPDPSTEATIKQAVVERAHGFRQDITPEEINVETLPDDLVPGTVVFRARYRFQDNRGAFTGIVSEGEEPNTYPNDALVNVWQRWLDGGGLPDAKVVAEVSAFLLGGAGPYEVVLDDTARQRLDDEDDDVSLPRLLDDGGAPGVVFWWNQRNGLSEMTLRLEGGMIDVKDRKAGE